MIQKTTATVVVLVSVQDVQNEETHFKFAPFEGLPIFGLCAFKNLWAFAYDCIYHNDCIFFSRKFSLVCYMR